MKNILFVLLILSTSLFAQQEDYTILSEKEFETATHPFKLSILKHSDGSQKVQLFTQQDGQWQLQSEEKSRFASYDSDQLVDWDGDGHQDLEIKLENGYQENPDQTEYSFFLYLYDPANKSYKFIKDYSKVAGVYQADSKVTEDGKYRFTKGVDGCDGGLYNSYLFSIEDFELKVHGSLGGCSHENCCGGQVGITHIAIHRNKTKEASEAVELTDELRAMEIGDYWKTHYEALVE